MNFLLKVEVGPLIGIGHLKRIEAIHFALSKRDINSYISCNSLESVSLEFRKNILDSSSYKSYESEIDHLEKKIDHVLIDLSHSISIANPIIIFKYCNYLNSLKISYSVIDGLGNDRLSNLITFPGCENYFLPYIGSHLVDLKIHDFKNIYSGASYSPLKTSSREKIISKKINSLPKKILITCGGSDPDFITKKILDLLFQSSLIINNLHMKVVIGPFYNPSLIASLYSIYSRSNIEFISGKSNLINEYDWADMVLTTIGTTRYECLSYNLPFLYFSNGTSEKYEPLRTFNSVLKYSYVGDFLFNSVCLDKLSEFFLSENKFSLLRSSCNNIIDLQGADRIADSLIKDRI